MQSPKSCASVQKSPDKTRKGEDPCAFQLWLHMPKEQRQTLLPLCIFNLANYVVKYLYSPFLVYTIPRSIQWLGTRVAVVLIGASGSCVHTPLWGPASGVCVEAEVSCRYKHSCGGQGRQYGRGPTVGSIALWGPLLSLYTTMAAGFCHRCMAVEASHASWANCVQLHCWRH